MSKSFSCRLSDEDQHSGRYDWALLSCYNKADTMTDKKTSVLEWSVALLIRWLNAPKADHFRGEGSNPLVKLIRRQVHSRESASLVKWIRPDLCTYLVCFSSTNPIVSPRDYELTVSACFSLSVCMRPTWVWSVVHEMITLNINIHSIYV